MTALAEVLARHDVTPANELLAAIEVPVISDKPQRQGDVAVFPLAFTDNEGRLLTVRPAFGRAEVDQMVRVPHAGVNVVVGEATGNRHILHPDDTDSVILWAPVPARDGSVLLGNLRVVSGVAMLVHTEEHGANAVGPGDYVVNGKREQADEVRRVAD